MRHTAEWPRTDPPPTLHSLQGLKARCFTCHGMKTREMTSYSPSLRGDSTLAEASAAAVQHDKCQRPFMSACWDTPQDVEKERSRYQCTMATACIEARCHCTGLQVSGRHEAPYLLGSRPRSRRRRSRAGQWSAWQQSAASPPPNRKESPASTRQQHRSEPDLEDSTIRPRCCTGGLEGRCSMPHT